jgi:hypothetical protein
MRWTWFRQQKRWPSRGNGNTLAEYIVIGCGVCLVVIATTRVLGGNLNNIMSDLRTDLSNHIGAAAHPVLKASAGPPSVVNYPPGSTVCYANNLCLQASALQDQGNAVQSTGANGSQQVLHEQSDLMSSIADQMANDPNADPTLKDLITRLANAGHTIADNLDSAVDSYNGKGGDYFSTYDAFWRSQMPYDALKKQTLDYLQAHPDALSPQVQTALHGAADSINARLAMLIDSTGPKYDAWQNMVQPIHQDSNNICANGGSGPSCTQ